MRNFKKALSILIAVVMLMSSMCIVSFAGGGYEPIFTSGNFIYKNCHFDDGIEIIGYTDASAKTISIPKQLDGRTVVGIGRHYEPKEGEYAFGSLKNLTSVSIPDSVTIIDNETFYGCAGLTSITIPNSVTNIFSHAFNGCTSLTSITIPNSVKEIDDWAFAGCTKLTSITISDSVTDISYSAFDETGYYNNEANWKDDVLYIGNILLQAKPTITGTYSIKYGTKVIAGHAFENCKSLTGITIPDSVVSIGYSAFWYCENLSSVIIPNGVTSINNNTFRGCTRLTSVTIPNSVTDIGIDAFSYCESLESITIPNSVKSIGSYAFEECCSLTSVTIPDSVTSIGEYAFASCTDLKSVTIPGSIENIAPWAFYRCSGLMSIAIENGVTIIGSGAFYSCSSLTDIAIPDSVTSIGYSAFKDTGYYNNSANWQNGVLYIGNYLIKADEVSGSYSVKSGTKTIAEEAFYYCDKLTGITLPDGLLNINASAFYGCENLTKITMPDSVTSVSYYVFEDTGYYNNEANWKNGVLYIGNHLIKAGDVSGSYSVKAGTKTIADEAFDYCFDLTSVTLPDTIVTIGKGAIFSDINDIYYSGTSEQWNKITICEGNEWWLNHANIHFTDSPQIHTHTLSHIVVPATCTVDGMEYDKCLECEETFNSKVIPAAHKYTSKIVAPTCTEKGYTEHICSACPHSYKDNYVDATGHKWGEWIRTTEPTMDTTGVETRECAVCHQKENKTVDKLKTLVDNTTGVKIGFEDEFEAGIEIKVKEVFDGQSIQVISNNFGDVKTKIFDITPEKDGLKVQPKGMVTIRIPVPKEFDASKIFVAYVDSTSGNTTIIPTKVIGGYAEFETDHFSQYALVEGKGKVKSVSINNLELQYKSSAKLNSIIEADDEVKYKVEYKSSDASVVTVDKDGNVYGAKKGNATITCIVTDEYGNTVQNTCNVNVKYAWWQWIIKIVLFGWLWY